MKGRNSPKAGFPTLMAVIAASLALTISAPAVSWAWWSGSASLPEPSLATGVITTPQNVSCQTVSRAGLAALARVTWNAVPDATSYLVTVRTANGATSAATTVTTPQIDIDQGLLGGLVGGLLQLLLGGTALQVTVQAQHGWASDPTTTAITIRNATALDGYLLGGIRCA